MSAGEVMLSEGLKICNWRLVERQTQQFGRGGGSAVVLLGNPYWEIDFEYANLTDGHFRALTAWINRRRGAMVNFSAYRPDRPLPLSMSTLPGGTSISEQASEKLRITTGTNKMGVGDMVAYDADPSGRFIGEIVEITANVSTYVDCKTVPPRADVHATPNLGLEKPKGLFTLRPDTLQISEPYDPAKRVSFSARQVEP